MSRTINGKLTGRAAATELADQREYIWGLQEKERRRIYNEQKMQECTNLYAECAALYGQAFIDWYDSPAVPEYGQASERIKLIEAWITENAGEVLTARRESILAAMREEPISQETALELIDELAEIETAMQKSADPTGQGWFDFEKIQEIKL